MIHRRLGLGALTVAALGATTGSAGNASADASTITVAEPPNPNLLLLLDSSGSMENWSDGTPDGKPATACVADTGTGSGNVCQTQSFTNGTTTVSAQNKWAGVIQALSGSAVQQPGYEGSGYFTWYEMSRAAGTSFATEYALNGAQVYDVGYSLNYHREASWDANTNAWCVLAPGVLPTGGAPASGVGTPPAYVSAAPDSYSSTYLVGLQPSYIIQQKGAVNPGAGGPPVWPATPTATCKFTLNSDGNIDAARDLVRFGLMTFDNDPDPGTGTQVVGTTLQTYTSKGLWSYFPGWNGAAASPAWPGVGLPPPPGTDQAPVPYNASPLCWSQGAASPACMPPTPYEVGARNPAAPPWEGRMVPFPNGQAPLSEQESTNDEIKMVIAATRPYGATPIAGMLTDARNYFRYDPNGPEQSDPYVNTTFSGGHGCRQQYIVLLTDGGANLDLRPTCNIGATGPQPETCPFQQPAAITQDLYQNSNFNPVTTFVIGYGFQPFKGVDGTTMTTCSALVGTPGTNNICAANPCSSTPPGFGATAGTDQNACCNLINIACAGSASNSANGIGPYFADSAADLNGAFASILGRISRSASSHVVPVFASASASGTSTFASEYFTASFTTSPVEPTVGAPPTPWAGTITREGNACPSSITNFPQVIPDPNQAIKRNYLTIKNTISGVADDTVVFRPYMPASISDGYVAVPTGTSQEIWSNASLSVLGSSDGGTVTSIAQGPFKITDFSCPADPSTGSRLGAEDCEKYVLGFWAGISPADGTNATVTAPNDFPGALKPTYQYVDRTKSWLGPIVNSMPAYVTAPSLALSDSTYRAFANAYSTRPNVLYVETTDGALHALDPDYVRGATGFSGIQEFWSFLPPAVTPNLPGNLPGASKTLLDGSPVVADTVFSRTTTTGAAATSPYDWHTTLVSSFGGGGPGYFALDVTEPTLGANNTTTPSSPPYPSSVKLDGPHFLWQLTGNGVTTPHATAAQPFGSHGATPAITTLYVQALQTTTAETGVAILPGGSDGQAPTGICRLTTTETSASASQTDGATERTMLHSWSAPTTATTDVLSGNTLCDNFPTPNGRTVSIVRLSDGAVIATFANPVDNVSLGLTTPGKSAVVKAAFTAPITGTPAVYPNGGGRLATTAYVSDADGLIWKLNFAGSDPTQWSATMFFDSFNALATSGAPAGSSGLSNGPLAANLGQPLTAAPILSIGPDSSLVLNFATGDQTLFTTQTFQAGTNDTQASIPIENFVYSVSDVSSGPSSPAARLNWFVPFDQNDNYTKNSVLSVPGLQGNFGERVTGPMAVFDGSLYFATLWPDDGSKVCSAGEARIYGMDYFNRVTACSGATSGSTKACGGVITLPPTTAQYDVPALDGALTAVNGTTTTTITSSEVAGALIPGVSVTEVQPCLTSTVVGANNYFAGASTQYTASVAQQPQLTFVTTASQGASSLTNTTSAHGQISLPSLQQPTRIDSWASVIN